VVAAVLDLGLAEPEPPTKEMPEAADLPVPTAEVVVVLDKPVKGRMVETVARLI
jgi:hypothetical protein